MADQYQTYLKLVAELQMNQVEKKREQKRKTVVAEKREEQKKKTVVAEKREEQKKSWTEN